MTDLSLILNSQEVAALLQCSVRTVENHARAGKLPGTKFGHGWIFSSELLIERVKAICLEEAELRARPIRKARGIKVAEMSKPKPPGMKHLSHEAIRQILSGPAVTRNDEFNTGW